MPTSGRHLDNWITGYLEYVAGSQGSEGYKYWTAISTVAACLQRKCYLPWDHLSTIYPNLFIILVGPSGVGKSRSIGPAREMLHRFYAEKKVILAPEKITAEAFMKIMASMSTEEEDGHVSISVFSSEIKVFVGTPPQNEVIVTSMCDFYDCLHPWSYETISRGAGIVNHMWVNLIGGATPEGVAGMFPETEAVHGGITGRIIFFCSEDPGPRHAKAPWSPKIDELSHQLQEDMESIISLEGPFKYSDPYFEAFVAWFDKNETPDVIANVPQLAPYITRRDLHVRKLSIIHCASMSNSKYITEEHFHLALESLEMAEQTMPYAFKAYGTTINKRALEKLVQHLIRIKEIKLRSLYTYFSGDFLFPDFKKFIDSVALMDPPIIIVTPIVLEDKSLDWIIKRVEI